MLKYISKKSYTIANKLLLKISILALTRYINTTVWLRDTNERSQWDNSLHKEDYAIKQCILYLKQKSQNQKYYK